MTDAPNIAQKAPFAVEVEEGKNYFWCSCGKSSKQPFCDGSHKDTGFTPVKYTAEASKKVFFCGCKHTDKNAHNGLPIDDTWRVKTLRQPPGRRQDQKPVTCPGDAGGPDRFAQIIERRDRHKEPTNQDKAGSPDIAKGQIDRCALARQAKARYDQLCRERQNDPSRAGIDRAEHQSVAIG